MIAYYRLWDLMNRRGLPKTYLRKIMSSVTLAKLGKNEPVNLTVIDKICQLLECQPDQVLEYVNIYIPPKGQKNA